MVKISWNALTQILLAKGVTCVIEPAENFVDRTVVKLVVGHGYPDLGSHITFKRNGFAEDNLREVEESRGGFKAGRIVMHYDLTNSCIIACCYDLYEAVKEQLMEAKRRKYQIKVNVDIPEKEETKALTVFAN